MPRGLIPTLLAALVINCAHFEILPKRENRTHTDWNKTGSHNRFKEYMKKYDPLIILNNLNEQQQKQGYNFTRKDYFDMAFEKLDASGDLLKLKVRNGNPKIILPSKDGRRWRPPVGPGLYKKDEFSLRRRFFELMKQALYQARNKMIIMQVLRDKYRPDPLYKMGYLMGKADTACKTFAKVAFRSYRICTMGRIQRIKRFSLYESLVLEEHLLHLLVIVDRLTMLIVDNHHELRFALKKHNNHLKKHWNFTP